jgi:hypothetical protein
VLRWVSQGFSMSLAFTEGGRPVGRVRRWRNGWEPTTTLTGSTGRPPYRWAPRWDEGRRLGAWGSAGEAQRAVQCHHDRPGAQPPPTSRPRGCGPTTLRPMSVCSSVPPVVDWFLRLMVPRSYGARISRLDALVEDLRRRIDNLERRPLAGRRVMSPAPLGPGYRSADMRLGESEYGSSDDASSIDYEVDSVASEVIPPDNVSDQW